MATSSPVLRSGCNHTKITFHSGSDSNQTRGFEIKYQAIAGIHKLYGWCKQLQVAIQGLQRGKVAIQGLQRGKTKI